MRKTLLALLPSQYVPGVFFAIELVADGDWVLPYIRLLCKKIVLARGREGGSGTAMLNGKIEGNGGASITEYGFVWGLNPSNPENKLIVGYGTSTPTAISGSIGGLAPGTTYYYYTYAKNGAETGRGDVKSFTTAQQQKVNGKVVVQFVVNKNGSVSDIKILEPLDPDCDKEVVRVLSMMPKWKPGKQRGKAVRVKYTVPVTFKLQ